VATVQSNPVWGKRNRQKWHNYVSSLLDAVEEHETRDVQIIFTRAIKYGDCWLDPHADKFIIRLGAKQCFSDAVHTLIHELAHVMAWEMYEDKPYHCDEWGIAYSTLYRHWEGYGIK
jgi:hypothetical protein